MVCDGDGTLELPTPSPAMRKLLQTLEARKIQLAVASNSSRASVVQRFKSAGLTVPKIIVTPSEVHKPKPAGEYMLRIRDLAGVELNEMLYVGDHDKTDIFCAINAGVLPLAAKYANPAIQYGFAIPSPQLLLDYIEIFCGQDSPYFGWEYASGTENIDVRALIWDHSTMTSTFKTVLKQHTDVPVGPKRVSATRQLLAYSLSQFYLSGLISKIDITCVYPGHRMGSFNPTLSEFLILATKMFRDRFIQDLLLRHTEAPKSQYQGDQRNIYDQFRTLQVNDRYKERIQGKRILVLDDFTTEGYSLETARHMLLRAGASKVYGVAMAKFKQTHAVAQIDKPWNPYAPCPLEMADIKLDYRRGSAYPLADAYFKENVWGKYEG